MELKGIKMGVLGDSITEGVGVTDSANIYYNRIQREFDMKDLYVDGISGTRIALQHKTSCDSPREDLNFLSRIDDIDEDCDLVVVFGGTNDFGHGDAPLGEPTDRTAYTFWGACHVMCEKLINRFPQSQIVVMGPLHRHDEENPCGEKKLEAIGSLYDYVDILKVVTRKYAIPFLDMLEVSGIAPSVPIHKKLYMPDGLHPNDVGHALIAAKLKGFLKTL